MNSKNITFNGKNFFLRYSENTTALMSTESLSISLNTTLPYGLFVFSAHLMSDFFSMRAIKFQLCLKVINV